MRLIQLLVQSSRGALIGWMHLGSVHNHFTPALPLKIRQARREFAALVAPKQGLATRMANFEAQPCGAGPFCACRVLGRLFGTTKPRFLRLALRKMTLRRRREMVVNRPRMQGQ